MRDVTITITIPPDAYKGRNPKQAAMVTAKYVEAAARQIHDGSEEGECTFGFFPLAHWEYGK